MGFDMRESQKQAAAKAAAGLVREGMTLGIGTGSTVYYLIREMGVLAASGMRFQAVATSERSRELAESLGIPVLMPEETERIDLAIDGVDEIDGSFCAVKGGGGALMREKIVAVKADEVIWIMDESKLTEQLGSFPLPVEVNPFGHSWAAEAIRQLGGHPVLRKKDGQIFRTDNGNYIYDVTFDRDAEYRSAAAAVRQIPGVLETGFFDSICSRILVGTPKGVKEIKTDRRVKRYGGR